MRATQRIRHDIIGALKIPDPIREVPRNRYTKKPESSVADLLLLVDRVNGDLSRGSGGNALQETYYGRGDRRNDIFYSNEPGTPRALETKYVSERRDFRVRMKSSNFFLFFRNCRSSESLCRYNCYGVRGVYRINHKDARASPKTTGYRPLGVFRALVIVVTIMCNTASDRSENRTIIIRNNSRAFNAAPLPRYASK